MRVACVAMLATQMFVAVGPMRIPIRRKAPRLVASAAAGLGRLGIKNLENVNFRTCTCRHRQHARCWPSRDCRSNTSKSRGIQAITAATEETDGERCVRLRGASGSWFVNETFGRETFYARGYRSNKWIRFNQNNKTAVYPGNKFVWQDTSVATGGGGGESNNKNENDCQIRRLTKRVFCDVTRELGIRRILFVGDSLTAAQTESLDGLIGFVGFKGSLTRAFDAAVDCPSGGGGGNNRSVKICFRRENLGPNYRKTDLANRTDAVRAERQQFGPEIPFCTGQKVTPGEHCPWHLLYNETAATTTDDEAGGRTLLVLNQGAHFHSMKTFANSFDRFVNLFNGIARPGDIVVFRATAPGHRDCWVRRNITIPEMTHDLFLDLYSTDKYDWNLHDSYNRYAREKMEKDLTPTVTGHYLNVYNMTVLRPDEHVRAADCLHYMHPGPIDYWNHLLFTNLADMARPQSAIADQECCQISSVEWKFPVDRPASSIRVDSEIPG